ncbi:hypothetical protein [Nocardioides aurantiacus]|nr:hypothetical protein [Nocardioides aurantiacus]
MMLAHAVLLAEARTYLGALADRASTLDSSLEYERVLLQVDWLHGGRVPPTTAVPTRDPRVLYTIACTAVSNLAAHGVDAMEIELCLAMLEEAHRQDTQP